MNNVVSICQAQSDKEQDNLEETVPEDQIQLPLVAHVGALLFVSSKPISAETIAQAVGSEIGEVEKALAELELLFGEERFGFGLKQVAGSWQLRTSPLVTKTIQKLIPPRAKKLSKAAAETLAVVAYKQPVQRSEIEAIRGVDALPTLKTLLDAKLIRCVGRDDSVGQPAIYGTTQTFLEKFGLRDLSELPSIREIAQLASEPGEATSDAGEEQLELLSDVEESQEPIELPANEG